MNKSAVFSHFSKILDNMIDNSLFFDTYFLAPSSIDDIQGSVDDPALPENINLYFGATRGCIVDDNYDYVVKFDVDEDGYTGSSCEREVEIYSRAKESNLDPYFAEVEYLGSYTKTIMFYDIYQITKVMDPCYYYDSDFDDEFAKYEDKMGDLRPVTISIPLYAYRKASSHWCIGKYQANGDKYEAAAKKINSPMRERNCAVAIDFVREYGEEIYQVLSDFMYQEDINDLHGGNVGDIDGHMVFYDYSGYHNKSSYSTSNY